MMLYILIPDAVYDHGVIGVYATEAEARAVAEDLWPHSDGHHDLAIVKRELGVTYDWSVLKWPYGSPPRDPGPPRIAIRQDPQVEAER